MIAAYLPYFVAGLAAVSIMFLSMGVIALNGERDKTARMLGRLQRKSPEEKAAAAQKGATGGLAETFRKLGEKIGPKSAEEMTEYRLRLIRAGYYNPNAVSIFWGIKFFLVVSLGSLPLLLRLLTQQFFSTEVMALMIIGGATLGYYLPALWLRQKTEKRQEQMTLELPDALDLLVVCVEAGMGLDMAITRVAEELRHSCPLISVEFKFLNLEMRAGKSRQDSLKNLAARVNLEDMTSLTTLLIQADTFGTSVAQTLRVYSDTLRSKRFQRAEEKAGKLPVKILLPLVMFILPALFVVIMGPAAIRLMFVFSKMP